MSCKSITCSYGKDEISDLPDEIILQILSFMDARTAIRIGILSKRFANLWTETPHLNFELATMEIVYNTLRLHKRLNLAKVSVTVSRKFTSDEEMLCRFIRLLSLASVKDLVLDFVEVDDYTLPQHFYSNPSLEKLHLKGCHIDINGLVNWKSLQSLSLVILKLSDETINGILSGCSSLGFLELSFTWGFSRIDLTENKCLRKLVIDDYDEEGTLEIVAPNLQSLVLSGAVNWIKCKVLNANSLTDCFLDFYFDEDGPNEVDAIMMLTSLLDDLSHAEVVTIGECVLQVLSLIELVKIPSPMSKAVKCLQIHTTLTKVDTTGIESLVRNLNCLETLSIELYDYDKEYFSILFSEKNRGSKSPWTSKDMQSNVDSKLKNVRIRNLVADKQFQYDGVLLLAKFLLKNANIMENMTISAKGLDNYLLKFTKTLLEFRRSSPCAVVKIEDW